MRCFLSAFLVVPCLVVTLCIPAISGVTSKVTREVIEETLVKAAQRSGRQIGGQTVTKTTSETLERLTKTYGNDVLKVISDGGIELVENVPKYGDDIIDIALKASPNARRTFARDLPELLPLTRRVGVDAVELEAKSPGLAAKVFTTFGDDGGRIIAKNVPAEDVPRLLSYAEKADSPTTRELLLDSYKKEGKSLFERVPAKLVLASGLSASMLLGTYEITNPARALGKAIESNKDIAGQATLIFFACGTIIILALLLCLLWRFGLMPWHRKTTPQVKKGKNQEIKSPNRSPHL
jgi:hypothetical protein